MNQLIKETFALQTAVTQRGGDSGTDRSCIHARYFAQTDHPLEAGYRQMIEGFELYCEGLATCGIDIIPGKDGYAAGYLENIANALLQLASMCGTFDGGTINRTVLAICERYEIDLNN